MTWALMAIALAAADPYTATERLTVYVPMAANPPWNATINGTACIGIPWELCKVQNGDAACSYDYPIGTVFILPAWVADYGIPTTVRCNDRGGKAVRIDIALVGPDVDGDLARAFALGNPWVDVMVYLPEGGAVLPPNPRPAVPAVPAAPWAVVPPLSPAERLDRADLRGWRPAWAIRRFVQCKPWECSGPKRIIH